MSDCSRSVRRQHRRSIDARHQIAKLKQRVGLKRVVLVGSRGMITQVRIDEERKPDGLDGSAFRAPAIQHLAAKGDPLH
jgi:hypothetical protein